MKRSRIERKSELKRGPAPKRRTRMKAVNRKRKARLYARNFGDHAVAIREMPCAGCGRPGPSDPAHVIGRKTGGCGGDRSKLVPLCKTTPWDGRVGCHALLDTDRAAFTARTGKTKDDMIALAAELWAARAI